MNILSYIAQCIGRQIIFGNALITDRQLEAKNRERLFEISSQIEKYKDRQLESKLDRWIETIDYLELSI